MGIKSFRPTTPSMRHTRLLDYAELAGEVGGFVRVEVRPCHA